jgi:DNA-directed RNA polymerase specialized sigma24 family protein
MDEDAALDRLPAAYASALRLRRSGAGDTVIAEALEIDIDAVPALLELATAKLTRVQSPMAHPTL